MGIFFKKKPTSFWVAVALIVIGIGFCVYSYAINNQIVAPIIGVTSDRPNGEYDEKPVTADDIKSYKVAPDMPRYFRIPSIDLIARVFKVGTDNKNMIKAPNGIFDVGWYTGSAKPGKPGAMFIDGHLNGSTIAVQGIFFNIHKLKNGDTVEIERGDGKKFRYIVKAVEVVDSGKVNMNKVLHPYGNASQGLNFMTCNGHYLEKEKTYDKRVIVYTTLE